MSLTNRILRPLLLATLLAVGAGVFWAIGIAVCFSTASQWLPEPEYPIQNLRITTDGLPVIRPKDQLTGVLEERAYQMLDGQLIAIPVELEDMLDSSSLAGLDSLERRFRRLSWGQRIVRSSDWQTPGAFWYLIHDGKLDGSAYLVGYDWETGLVVGYIGRGGFRQDEPPRDDHFPIDGRKLRGVGVKLIKTSMLLLADDGLVEIDLPRRTVRRRIDSDDLISIDAFRRAEKPGTDETSSERKQTRTFVAVRATDRVIVLDQNQTTFTIPREIRGPGFDFYQVGDDAAIAHLRDYDRLAGTVKHRLFWFDRAGKIARREEIVLSRYRPHRPLRESSYLACLVPVPAFAAVDTLLNTPMDHLGMQRESSYSGALARSLNETWPALVITGVLSVLLIPVCYRRQRRFSQPWTKMWAVFVFIFGLPGLAGYLAHRRWPALASCPACDRTVPRDRQICSDCEAPFPEPERQGIEVFCA
jgi:hypothetical protein